RRFVGRNGRKARRGGAGVGRLRPARPSRSDGRLRPRLSPPPDERGGAEGDGDPHGEQRRSGPVEYGLSDRCVRSLSDRGEKLDWPLRSLADFGWNGAAVRSDRSGERKGGGRLSAGPPWRGVCGGGADPSAPAEGGGAGRLLRFQRRDAGGGPPHGRRLRNHLAEPGKRRRGARSEEGLLPVRS